ncbi:MAG: hypothetical protein HY865_00835 [Chloroflexi bacterium]|nr:hypothetical protein [Chloroflexota bacterium]
MQVVFKLFKFGADGCFDEFGFIEGDQQGVRASAFGDGVGEVGDPLALLGQLTAESFAFAFELVPHLPMVGVHHRLELDEPLKVEGCVFDAVDDRLFKKPCGDGARGASVILCATGKAPIILVACAVLFCDDVTRERRAAVLAKGETR